MEPGLRSFLQRLVLFIGVSSVVLCLLPPVIFAENSVIYRWVDPVDKSIHFSQTAPAGIPSETVKVEPPPPTGSDTQKRLQEMQKSVEEGIKSRELSAEKQRQEAEKAAKRKQECQRLKDRLTSLQTRPGKILYEDKSGQMQRMTEERRQQNIAKFKEQIKSFCSP